MKAFFIALCFAVVLLACTNSSHNTASSNSTLDSTLQRLLDSTFKAHPETKGIAVHVEAPNVNYTWASAVGNANTQGKKLTADLPGNIASNTKTYVAAAILRLVEIGKIASIQQPIAGIISNTSEQQLRQAGYDVDHITITHLATNTSGIYDYVNTDQFQGFTLTNLNHRWTRDEQIALAMSAGKPRWAPGARFEYCETGFLLLTEIIEHYTQKPFHTAIRELLKFDQLGLHETWFLLQENAPNKLPPLLEQTATRYQSNSLTLDVSFDAFGGGGLAATPRDLANFSQQLFDGKIFDHPKTRQLLYTTTQTADSVAPTYSFGLMMTNVAGHKAYGHGGFWGTQVKYIPDLNASIAVFVLESDAWEVYNDLIAAIAKELER